MSAKTWDSYKETVDVVLTALRPKHVFEWGAGKSTKLFSAFESVETVDTVEHNTQWIDRVKGVFHRDKNYRKVYLIYEPNQSLYPMVTGRFDKYDLIFVDGLVRPECLAQAKNMLGKGGCVVLHDAEREAYQDVINTYPYRFIKDDGSTAVLIEEKAVADHLSLFFGETVHA